MKSLLLTQCLQNDFVAPLGPWENMPCLLHIGSAEAARLMGADPAEGPVSRFLDWAHDRPVQELDIVHIRDAHDPDDPNQSEHLLHFGSHCLQGTAGIEFAFTLPPARRQRVEIIDSTTLNDFIGTGFEDLLDRKLPGAGRVGIIGAWTDAKVSFLAYELRTRFPSLEIGVCSALTASSSRERHIVALDHLERIMGVRIFHSVGEFAHFLVPQSTGSENLESRKSYLGSLEIRCDVPLRDDDRELLGWLFRGSSSLDARCLDGGFSGNVVLGVESRDIQGRTECPHVVKIGSRALIGQERVSFETIETILGNSAPRIADYFDLGDRGGIKYRYASMTGAKSRTLQSLWISGLGTAVTEDILRTVFEEQLGRLYNAAQPEQVDLLDIWGFRPEWADGIASTSRSLGMGDPSMPCELHPGIPCLPVLPFYRDVLPKSIGNRRELAPMARVHGDLNGANILIDARSNVWLIDFFHSRKHHVVCDFAKLENDLLHIWTPLPDPASLKSFAHLLETLMAVTDLGEPLPEASQAGIAMEYTRTWETLRMIRKSMVRPIGVFRDPWHHRIAALRYAAHTIGFEEPSTLQRQGALVHAGLLAKACRDHLEEDRRLRVDWIPLEGAPGRLGLTILPGRGDRGRNLAEDIDRLAELGTDVVFNLVTDEELSRFGVGGIVSELEVRGIVTRRYPILDQKACDPETALSIAREILDACRAGSTVVVHCVGGIGRSGMIAACVEVLTGMDPGQAIATVRARRSPRALETSAQIETVRALSRLVET